MYLLFDWKTCIDKSIDEWRSKKSWSTFYRMTHIEYWAIFIEWFDAKNNEYFSSIRHLFIESYCIIKSKRCYEDEEKVEKRELRK